jgi:hypothetical protein
VFLAMPIWLIIVDQCLVRRLRVTSTAALFVCKAPFAVCPGRPLGRPSSVQHTAAVCPRHGAVRVAMRVHVL